MTQLVLAHAPQDRPAAERLRALLTGLGYTLPESANDAAQVLALLTPAALAAPAVTRALQDGAIPVTVANLETFPSAADLASLLQQLGRRGGSDGGYLLTGTVINSAIGPNATTVNVGGGGSLSPQATAALIELLRRRPAHATLIPDELGAALARIESGIAEVGAQVGDLHGVLIARFDRQEQRILAPLLARLDANESRLLDAILDTVTVTATAADELAYYWQEVEKRLDVVVHNLERMPDPQLAAASQRTAEIVKAPELDTRHRLKLTIPLIPVLLQYESELDVSGGLHLAEMWRDLVRWAQGQ